MLSKGRQTDMPKKTTKETVITETDSKPEEMDSPVQVIAPSMEELDFSEYLESLGPTTNLIKIHKYIDGTRKYCGRVEPSVIKVEGEEYLLRHWGGGKYYLMAFFNGRYVQDGSRLIEVFEIPEEKKVQIAALDSVSQSAFLQAEIQRQHEMVLRLLEGQKAPAPQGPTLKTWAEQASKISAHWASTSGLPPAMMIASPARTWRLEPPTVAST